MKAEVFVRSTSAANVVSPVSIRVPYTSEIERRGARNVTEETVTPRCFGQNFESPLYGMLTVEFQIGLAKS